MQAVSSRETLAESCRGDELFASRAFAEPLTRLSTARDWRNTGAVHESRDQGWYPAFTGYRGSQSLRAETFIALVEDVLLKLVSDGARSIAIINTGVSTEAPLTIAVRTVLERTGVAVSVADIRNLGHAASAIFEQNGGGHADEHETSLMLAIDPSRVHMDRAVREPAHDAQPTVFRVPATLRDDPAAGDGYSRTGASGDPTLASAGKGVAILGAMVRDLVDGLRVRHPDAHGVR